MNKEIIRLKHETKRVRSQRSRQTWSQSEVTHLKQRIKELEGIIDNMNHDCLANLIQTSKPRNMNEMLVASLKFRIKEQKQDQGNELKNAHQASEKVFKRLRSQNRKLKQKLKSIRIDSKEDGSVKKQDYRGKYPEIVKTLKERRKSLSKTNLKISKSSSDCINLRKKTSSSSSRRDSVTSGKISKFKREKAGLKANHSKE